MSETEPTTTRRRATAKTDEPAPAEAVGVDDAYEKGYVGGPADETDHTVAGEIAAAEAAAQEAGD